MSKRSKGFSLIELMIVVAIVGILAAIVYPGYTRYIKKTHRAAITGLMTEAAQSLERHYSRASTYKDKGAIITTLPTGDTWYTLAAVRNDSDFTLTATPRAGTVMASDECGSFTLTNTGARGNTNLSSGTTTATCWGR